jgi:hypothetical protein
MATQPQKIPTPRVTFRFITFPPRSPFVSQRVRKEMASSDWHSPVHIQFIFTFLTFSSHSRPSIGFSRHANALLMNRSRKVNFDVGQERLVIYISRLSFN